MIRQSKAKYMTDNTELNSDEKSTDIVVENTNNVWKLITPKLLSAVNITAFLTVAGFFVIHSYIQSFSDFYTYNIAVSQYLVAGINMILGTLGFFIPLFFSSIPAMFIGVVLGFVLIVIIYFSPLKKWRVQINKVLQISQVVSFGFLLVMVAFVGFAYGTTLYAHSPRMFGGGMPAQVVLVFQEEQDIQNPLWSFPIDPSNPKKSLPVPIPSPIMRY